MSPPVIPTGSGLWESVSYSKKGPLLLSCISLRRPHRCSHKLQPKAESVRFKILKGNSLVLQPLWVHILEMSSLVSTARIALGTCCGYVGEG